MNKGLIITLPRHEYAVEYLTISSKSIILEANKKNLKVKELKGEDANQKNFEAFIKNLNYKLVVFNGHGSEDTITGHDNNPLVQFGVNDSLLQGRITYARSCWAACVLGKESMKRGKGCFIGYALPFMFYIDDQWRANPHKDKVAPIFLEPSNLVPISIIKGNVAFQAHENSKKQILKTIKKILRAGSDEAFLFAEKLWNNYNGQVIYGNKEAKL